MDKYRFGRDLGVVEIEMVRFPPSQELGTENFTDDGARMSDATQLDVAFRQQFQEASMENRRRRGQQQIVLAARLRAAHRRR